MPQRNQDRLAILQKKKNERALYKLVNSLVTSGHPEYAIKEALPDSQQSKEARKLMELCKNASILRWLSDSPDFQLALDFVDSHSFKNRTQNEQTQILQGYSKIFKSFTTVQKGHGVPILGSENPEVQDPLLVKTFKWFITNKNRYSAAILLEKIKDRPSKKEVKRKLLEAITSGALDKKLEVDLLNPKKRDKTLEKVWESFGGPKLSEQRRGPKPEMTDEEYELTLHKEFPDFFAEEIGARKAKERKDREEAEKLKKKEKGASDNVAPNKNGHKKANKTKKARKEIFALSSNYNFPYKFNIPGLGEIPITPDALKVFNVDFTLGLQSKDAWLDLPDDSRLQLKSTFMGLRKYEPDKESSLINGKAPEKLYAFHVVVTLTKNQKIFNSILWVNPDKSPYETREIGPDFIFPKKIESPEKTEHNQELSQN